jgi:hypothetical protein
MISIWMLVPGCWMLDTGSWVLDAGWGAISKAFGQASGLSVNPFLKTKTLGF